MEEKKAVSPAVALAVIAIAIVLIAVVGWKVMSPSRVGANGVDLSQPSVQPGSMPGAYGHTQTK